MDKSIAVYLSWTKRQHGSSPVFEAGIQRTSVLKILNATHNDSCTAMHRCRYDTVCIESLTCPPGPPYPVDVSVNVLCDVIVDNRLDGRNVQTSSYWGGRGKEGEGEGRTGREWEIALLYGDNYWLATHMQARLIQ